MLEDLCCLRMHLGHNGVLASPVFLDPRLLLSSFLFTFVAPKEKEVGADAASCEKYEGGRDTRCEVHVYGS